MTQIHRLLNGERRLTVDTRLRFCNVLDLDICQLFAEHRKIPVKSFVNSAEEVLPTPTQPEQQIPCPRSFPE
ncbi:MAG: hypothetical protein JJ934_04250 [Pseudomonadales bacterium]|nr:hypothetical protein [Pseudomonadales bacterium]